MTHWNTAICKTNNINIHYTRTGGNSDKGVVSPAVAEELQHLNPGLQVEQITDAGHSLHLDQPERFAAVARTFLNSIEP
ncbi:alpha/beta fold hydrolase [Chitinophaga tropicalis]|uniref:Alpha/beta hydrolase n=1 Tax=Chitinophaga tropicalis TaxID=2683588 RepID=A0A7K1U333_9BACT|nr:alpha/beta hydrolase [Chitinophaga tropicalis]MVT08761.1 hypothetical protein [Chitinophaga tropicalis]